MILLIDLGNTRLKWALRDGAEWVDEGASAHGDGWRLERLQQLPEQGRRVSRILASNVAGAALGARLEHELAVLGVTIEWLRPGLSGGGVRNDYQNPTQLGPDRWAALVGARARHAGACLVVSAGTATTVDVLDADGVFRGGLILPGLAMMRRVLAGNTARLPFADGHYQDYPRATADAIVTGCLHAQVGAIERMFSRVADCPGARVILTGGAAEALLPLLDMPFEVAERLILEGLALLAAEAAADVAVEAGQGAG